MGGVSPVQIVIVLAIVLLVFGPSRLPEIGRSVGRGVRELKDSLGGDARTEQVQGSTASKD